MRSYRKVHNYLVGECISRSPLSQVYVGFRTSDRAPVAIKLTSKRQLAGSAQEHSILFNERILAPLLTHHHIVETREVIEAAGQVFQVMDLYPESDLLSYISRRTLPHADLIRIADEILSAVEYLHSLKLCHRDLKPENVLMTDSGHARLTDFAFAGFCVNSTDKTPPCGSLGYAAPEVFVNDRFDGQKADVWSLGVILFFLFAGKLPFPDDVRVRPSRVDYSGIPADVAALISRILRAKPSDRPTVFAIRQDAVFDKVAGRLPPSPVLDFSSPVLATSPEVLLHLSEALEISEGELEMRLGSDGATKEKVMYHLIGRHAEPVEAAVSGRPNGLSLPARRLLSESCPCLQGLEEEGSQVIEDRNVVVRAVVNFMLGKKFCVSGRPGESKKLVQNRDGDDIHLDLNVSLPDGVAVSGDVESGLPVIQELEMFLLDEYGVITSY